MKKYLPKFHITTILYIGMCFYLQWYKEPLVLLGIVLFHEYAHFIVALLLGYDIEGMVVYPFGAFLKINDYGYKEIRQDFWVAIAGACSHLLLYGLAYLLKDYMGMHVYDYFIAFNLQVLFFNLLPIYPMDGSKICLCLLSYFLDYLVCLKLMLVVSFMSFFLLVYYHMSISYVFVYLFLWVQLYHFSITFYVQYYMTILRRTGNNKRRPILHDDFKFYRNKQNFYLYNGKILDEKSFVKSRIFIDNTNL